MGRRWELAELRDGLSSALSGHGCSFLVSGESGVGKTTLADTIAREAAAAGAQVRWGRCWEHGGAPPFWPWDRLLRDASQLRDHEVLASLSDLTRGGVAEPQRVGGDLVPLRRGVSSDEPEQARFRLFDASANLLREASAAQPLVLIIDDAHTAELGSLRLLQFVARELRDLSILLIVTYRDAEVRQRRAVAEVIGELARDSRSLPLRGLTAADVHELVRRILGRQPSETITAAIHEATMGNPFFVDEIVRLLRAEGRFDLPDAVALQGFRLPDQARESLRRRLRSLNDRACKALEIAAVAGRRFSIGVLAAATQRLGTATLPRQDEWLDLLAEPADLGLLVRSTRVPGSYQFSHSVIQETLYEGLDGSYRARIHGAIGEALAERYQGAPSTPWAALAHHFVSGGSERGSEYARRAGDDAFARLAYEEAAQWYGEALAALEANAPAAATVRLDLLLALADALAGSGDATRRRASLVEAAELARGLGNVEAFSRAAIAIGSNWEPADTDDQSTALLEEALEQLASTDSALRIEVLSALAHGLSHSAHQRAQALSDESVVVARRCGDRGALALALLRHASLLSLTGRWPEHAAVIQEALEAAEGGDPELTFHIRLEQSKDCLRRGDIEAFRTIAEMVAQRTHRARSPFWRRTVSQMRFALALLEGRWEDGQWAVAEMEAVGEPMPSGSARVAPTRLLMWVDRERGSLDRLETLGRALPTTDLPYDESQAIAAARDRNDLEGVKGILQGLENRNVDRLCATDLPSFAALVEGCAYVADARWARAMYDMLLSNAGACVAHSYCCSLGSADRYLGLLAACFGDRAAAQHHFDAALAMNAALRARPWLAHTQHDYARFLLGSSAPEERQHGRYLLEEALESATILEMHTLRDRIQRLLSAACSPRAVPIGQFEVDQSKTESRGSTGAESRASEAAAREPDAVFRREGDFWTVVFSGASIRLRHTKGLLYIEQLLKHPGEPLHATHLLYGGGDGPSRNPDVTHAIRGMSPGLGDAGVVLDAQAKIEYKRRLHELRGEIDEARAFNDTGRLEHAEAELEFLTQELSHAVGLGGRDRRASSDAERARVSVTRAISYAIKRIAAHHSPLAQHLMRCIRTGTFCTYVVEAAARWGD